MKFPKITVSTSLLFKIVGSFFLLAGFTVLIITISTNVRGRNALEESVFDRLSVASSLKEYQLVQWFDGQYREVILLSELNDVRDQVNVILRLNRRPFDAELVGKLKQNTDISMLTIAWIEPSKISVPSNPKLIRFPFSIEGAMYSILRIGRRKANISP